MSDLYFFPACLKTQKKTINTEDDAGLQTLIVIQVKYLVGAADQFEDVDLWMWFSIVRQ